MQIIVSTWLILNYSNSKLSFQKKNLSNSPLKFILIKYKNDKVIRVIIFFVMILFLRSTIFQEFV